MNLVLIAALIAVCGAAKLDRTYLPPSSANSAGGSPGSLQAPLTKSSEQASVGLPTGSYTNNFEGVVVDAASSGTRSSDAGQSGLGNPRPSYGSSDSKVGDAAFRGTVAGFRGTPSFEASSSQGGAYEQSSLNTQNLGANGFTLNGEINTNTAQGFPSNGPVVNHQTGNHAGQFSNNFQGFTQNKPERPQSAKDRNSNILTLSNDVNTDSYSYGFETDNGIAVGENGVAMNGIQAEGGYSYQGDDGQVYKVTYTADEGGYRPQGAHLPTPPPIPDEILKSLEQNAKEEAAGHIDDGSYDAQKYNADGDYTHDNSGNIQYNGAQFGKRPDSNTPIGTFNQNYHAYRKPGSQTSQPGAQFGAGFSSQAITGHSTQGNGQFGTGHFGVASNEHNGQFSKPGSGELETTGQSTFNGQPTQVNGQPGSAVFGTQSHTTFEQSSLNQFNSNPVLPHNVNSGSQSSHSSQPLSGQGNVAAGQAFTQNTGNQFSSLSDQASGASGSQAQLGSQFSQHASASGSTQLGNQSPDASLQNHQQLSQFGSKPSFTQGAESFQSTQPQFGSSFKPQGSEAFSGASLNKDQDAQDFGKPFPQTFSGQNFNRPSVGNFNKPTFGQGQTYKGSSNANGFNRFPQSSGQVGVVNDYINPFNSIGQSQPDKSTVSAPGVPLNLGTLGPSFNGVEAGQKEQIPELAVNKPKPGFASASASTSFGQPAFQPQPVKPLNVFNTQPPLKPNQFTQQQTTQFTPQTNQLASQSPAQFNSNSQFSGESVSDLGSKPTAIPDTELTTPLEPNESSGSQSSQSSSQIVSTFDSSSSEFASSQAHFGHQGNSASGQSNSQTLPSSFPTTTSQISPGFETASSQSGFQSSVGKQPENINDKPQISGNTFGQNEQGQGIDNSYYYRQPTMPFRVPSAVSQGSRYPSSSSYQSNTIASQNQFFNQQNLPSTTKFPGSPSLATVGPTSSTQFAQTQGYSGITQAAISPFPSVSPTPSSQYGMTQNGQFASKPSFNQQSTGNQALSLGTTKPSYSQQSFSNQAQITENQGNAQLPQPDSGRLPLRPITQIDESQTLTQSGQPESSDSSSQQQATQVQQYQGTVYQYNKPAEVIPAPSEIDSSSSQSIQAGITSGSKPSVGQSQGNQLSLPSTQQNLKPDGSFGTQNRPFGSAPTGVQGQHSQTGQGSQIIQQTGIQSGSQQTQFNAPSPTNTQSMSSELQPAKPFDTTSTTHFSSLPASSPTQGSPSSFETKPQFIGQTQFSQTFGNSRPSQSQFFQNSESSQSNGYFYPGYPKPQFGEVPKIQFNHNSQSGKPQSGLNKFNQNAHLGHSQTTSFFNRPPSNFNPGLGPQDSQFPQATFGQKILNSPIQPFSQSKFGQSTASSQAVASGQATASASASTSPQQYKPFGSQTTNQFGQKDSQDREPTQFDTQNAKPFGSVVQEPNGASSSKPFGSGNSQGSKPLFDSACCQGSKDSTPAQSTDRPNQGSFQGTQNTQSVGKGKEEEFGGPRQPPTFDDQTGYHY